MATQNLDFNFPFHPALLSLGLSSSEPAFFGDVNHFDRAGHKIGYSEHRLFWGGYNHFDKHGKKIGYSEDGYWGDVKHYDPNGKKVGASNNAIFSIAEHIDREGNAIATSDFGFFGTLKHTTSGVTDVVGILALVAIGGLALCARESNKLVANSLPPIESPSVSSLTATTGQKPDSYQNKKISASGKIDQASVNIDYLNLRSCPVADDKKCPPVAIMLKGVQVKIVQKLANGWLEVNALTPSHETLRGFANGRYLDSTPQ